VIVGGRTSDGSTRTCKRCSFVELRWVEVGVMGQCQDIHAIP